MSQGPKELDECREGHIPRCKLDALLLAAGLLIGIATEGFLSEKRIFMHKQRIYFISLEYLGRFLIYWRKEDRSDE